MKSLKRCVVASVLVGCALPVMAAERAEAAESAEAGSRKVEIMLSPSKVTNLGRNLWGEADTFEPDTALRGCQQTSTHLDNGFNDTQWNGQGGFAEQEIMAASYTVSPSLFPLRIDSLQGFFVTSQTNVTTTTEWSVLVWEGTPASGNLVAEFSSDDVILPHLVMPPGTNGTIIEVSVDPGDPEQIIVQDNGTATFSIGFRIDAHNNQTSNPCFTAPPSSSNAFPATDTNGLQNATNNWLFGVNCGPFGCPANGGWTTFAALPGFCRPSGDWALSSNWTSLSCTPGVGACCLPDGSCTLDSSEACDGAGGVFQGDGTTCADVVCEPLPQSCCFESSGGCLDLSPDDCLMAGGVPGGVGTECSTTVCFPEGACCLPDGSCADGLTPEDCAMMNGTFQGDGTECASITCPEPTGGCCFPTGFCLELTEGDCVNVDGSWGGAGTVCEDANGNGDFDLCEEPAGCNAADLAEPFDVLDLADISAFVGAFTSQDPLADLAPPMGVFDLADLSAFVNAFVGGCP